VEPLETAPGDVAAPPSDGSPSETPSDTADELPKTDTGEKQ
jgi:hypothetical protein